MKTQHLSRIRSILMLCLSMCLLMSCSQQISSTPPSIATLTATATPTATSIPLLFLTPPPVTSLPQDCLALSPIHKVFSQFGPVAGDAPIWVAGFTGQREACVVMIPGQDTYTQYGWQRKFVWTVGPDFTQQVTLKGQEIHSKEILRFDVTDDDQVTATAILDPHTPNHPVAAAGSHYAEWGSYLYIPKAGCYEIVATWSTGKATFRFAAGRQ